MTASRFAVVALLILSVVNFGLMVPGGFVETRNFSAYPLIVLVAFNVFLTALGLGSLMLSYIIARGRKGCGLSVIAGLSFVAVYLLDLGHIFPVSSMPMSMLLVSLEWLGTGLGGVLAVTAIWCSRQERTNPATPDRISFSASMLVVIAVVAVIIVAFATKSAMGI